MGEEQLKLLVSLRNWYVARQAGLVRGGCVCLCALCVLMRLHVRGCELSLSVLTTRYETPSRGRVVSHQS